MRRAFSSLDYFFLTYEWEKELWMPENGFPMGKVSSAQHSPL